MWHYSKILSMILLDVAGICLILLDDVMQITLAVSRGITQRQLKNIWAHKTCFEVKSQNDDGGESDRQSYFVHKQLSLWVMIKNVVLFLKGDILRSAKTQSKRIRVKR